MIKRGYTNYLISKKHYSLPKKILNSWKNKNELPKDQDKKNIAKEIDEKLKQGIKIKKYTENKEFMDL